MGFTFLSKMELFLKIENFVKNQNFWKIELLVKNPIFGQKMKFLANIDFFVKNENFVSGCSVSLDIYFGRVRHWVLSGFFWFFWGREYI